MFAVEVFQGTEEDRENIRKSAKYVLGRTATSCILHPFYVTKTLVQIGHEPYPLTYGKTFAYFGQQAHFFPNFFSYTAHHYKEKGLSSLYTGVGPMALNFLVSFSASKYCEMYIDKFYPNFGGVPGPDENVDLEPYKLVRKTVRKCSRASLCSAVGVILSRPFQVVAIHQIAQLVGGENVYIGVFSSLTVIKDRSGISGWFAGLLPQLVAEIGSIWILGVLSSSIDYFWAKYVQPKARSNEDIGEEPDEGIEEGVDETEVALNQMKQCTNIMLPMVVNTLVYPLQLTSVLMAINDSGLVAARYHFDSWSVCLDFLRLTKQAKRGSKMFLRRAT